MNAPDWKKAVYSIMDKLEERGLATLEYKEASNLLRFFKNAHKDISQFICNDFGIKAMFYDALIIEDCLRELMVRGRTIVLPVHDELLCPADKVEIVKEQMKQSYRKILKRALVDNGTLNKDDQLPENLLPVIG